MAPRSCAWRSPCVNLLANPTREQNKFVGQSSVQKSNVRNNKAPIKAFTPLKALTLPFVPSSTKDLFTKFIKIFIKMM